MMPCAQVMTGASNSSYASVVSSRSADLQRQHARQAHVTGGSGGAPHGGVGGAASRAAIGGVACALHLTCDKNGLSHGGGYSFAPWAIES